MFKSITLFILLSITTVASGQYTVSGQINMSEGWQPKVYMAAINKLSDYYRTSPDMILNTASVDDNGRFLLKGDNLPTDDRFYRLYVMKNQNTDYDACLYVGGEDHNFVHVILKNGDSVEIQSDSSSVAPFGGYRIDGGAENKAMEDLSRIVFPSFYFYRIKFPTELKFSEDKFHKDLRNFVDSSSHTMVALAAINNMDLDEYFDRDEAFFLGFGDRLNDEFPKSVYTKNYRAKMRYYAGESLEKAQWPFLLIGLLILGLITSLFSVRKLRNEISILKSKTQGNELSPREQMDGIKGSLTQKEEQILELIHKGKSNKEIAAALFIELSTVKSHINKLYAKIGASSRTQARGIANQIYS